MVLEHISEALTEYLLFRAKFAFIESLASYSVNVYIYKTKVWVYKLKNDLSFFIFFIVEFKLTY